MTTAKITAKRSNLHVAPEGVTFQVDVTGFDTPAPARRTGYDERLHELHYVWDFGDPGQYSAPQNVAPAHRNSNAAFGPIVSHVFRAPGTYTVSLRISEPSSGKTATAQHRIIVGDADRVFAGANTLFVDPRGNYAGAPAGSVGVTSLGAALGATRGTGPKRIMLRRGHAFAINSVRLRKQSDSLYFAASAGNQAKPVLIWKPGQDKRFFWIGDMDPQKTKDISFDNIRFQGPWDASTETGAPQISALFTGKARPAYMLVNSCEFDGFATSITVIQSAAENDILILNDSIITNWQDYGIYEEQQGYTSMLGCRISQHPDALSGGPKNWQHNRHGCIRIQKGGRFVMDGCDLFSRTGWFENIKGWHTSQSCLRWNQLAVPGALANIQRCSAEGGYQVFALSTMTNAIVPKLQNAIVDKCLLVGAMMSSSLIRVNYSGTTIRNCILIHPDIPRDISPIYDPAQFIALQDLATDRANTRGPIRLYNNTFVNLMTKAHYHSADNRPAVVFANTGFTDVTEENNVTHQPNLPRPQVDDAPLDQRVVFKARHKGYRSFQQKSWLHRYGVPARSVATYAPLTGSDALGDAISGFAGMNDFLGRPRPPFPSRGAMEMP